MVWPDGYVGKALAVCEQQSSRCGAHGYLGRQHLRLRVGSTLQATLQRLNITPSYSRPRVSNDNAFSESLFRTCKYRPDYPKDGYESLSAAQQWVTRFVHWYNHEHRHSAIRFVTPGERHAGQDNEVLARRDAIYAEAKRQHPGRWSSATRNWTPRRTVWLNPDREDPLVQRDQRLEAA